MGIEGFVGGSDRSVDAGGSWFPKGNLLRDDSSWDARAWVAEETGMLDAGRELLGVIAERGRRRRAASGRETGMRERGVGGASEALAIEKACARAPRQASNSASVRHAGAGTSPRVAIDSSRAVSPSDEGRSRPSTNERSVASSIPEARTRYASLAAGAAPSQ